MFAALLTIGPGCRMTLSKSKSAGQTQETKNVAANQNQVRLRMRALVQPMCGELEQTANEIVAGTTDRAVQQAALRWKIEGVPALREALFQPDPLTAAMDTWVLCYQMADYFETGPGKDLLGDASTRAVETCRRMEDQFSQLAASMTISGDVSKARAFARKWAAEHRIHNSISGRESTLSRVLEREIADSFSIGEAVMEVTTTVDDLNRKLGIYSDQLFRQARWEAELFRLELLEELSADQAIPLAERAVKSAEQAGATVERLAAAFERTAGTVQDLPKLVGSERQAFTESFHADILTTIAVVQSERLAALNQLHESMATERARLMRDMDEMRLKGVEQVMSRVERLMALVVAVALLALFLGLFLMRQLFLRRPLEVRRGTNG